MLNKLRNFSKGKLAGVLVGIIIIPFVFWGMGSVFSGGNTNSIGKINNYNISTQEFSEFINNSKIKPEIIRQNIENNVIEELLTQLISTKLIEFEIEKLNVSISDEILASQIKKQKDFKNENNIFSRTKYEKFLLERNMSPVEFEEGIKSNELRKKLFTYISGGIRTPYFLINKEYKQELKNIDVEYTDLKSLYVDEQSINLDDLKKHVDDNKETFLIEKADISYVKITPENLVGENEFSENFFSKIDEIEDLILNNSDIEQITKKFNLKLVINNSYDPDDKNDEILKQIYKKKNISKIEIEDKNDYFLLYQIKNLKKILPSLDDKVFIKKVKNDFIDKNIYNVHKGLFDKIQSKKFTDKDFFKVSNGNTKNIKIKSINDNKKFTSDSVNLLYSLGMNSFSLVSDNDNNIYLVKIINIYEKNLDKSSNEIIKFKNQANSKIRDNLYNSYDYLMNDKYKIKVNENTLNRMKNYFR